MEIWRLKKVSFSYFTYDIIIIIIIMVKNSPANAGAIRDGGLIPGWGRSPAEGYGNPLQYSRLENFMDREAWGAKAQGLLTWLKQFST